MIVPVPDDEFASTGVVFDEVGGVGVFGLPTDNPEVFEVVKVGLKAGGLEFIPHRSSAHKRVLALLGLGVE